MALFFGLQSLQAYSVFGWFAEVYRDAGFSAGDAGLLLGVITGTSIPLSFVVPTLAARAHEPDAPGVRGDGLLPGRVRRADPRPALAGRAVGGAGRHRHLHVPADPHPDRPARTYAGGHRRALSGFTQAAGYLLAGIGPFGVGVLHDATGGWTVPLLALVAICVPAAGRRAGARAAGVRRGRAGHARLTAHGMASLRT